MAVGTGFGQLFRGIGQVGGVGIASSIFQSLLDAELRKRIHRPDADQIIREIRHSSKLVATLPADLQTAARDSYAIALRAVFIYAACATFLAYLVRLQVCNTEVVYAFCSVMIINIQIPEKSLDSPELSNRTKRKVSSQENGEREPSENHISNHIEPDDPFEYGDAAEVGEVEDRQGPGDRSVDHLQTPQKPKRRRLSTYESSDGGMDLESDDIGGSARHT